MEITIFNLLKKLFFFYKDSGMKKPYIWQKKVGK